MQKRRILEWVWHKTFPGSKSFVSSEPGSSKRSFQTKTKSFLSEPWYRFSSWSPSSRRKVMRQKVLSFRNSCRELQLEKRCNTGAEILCVRGFSALSSETALGADPRKVCFARIRFRHCQITLPLFERDWQSLKLVLRQNSLPKVQFATSGLSTGFFPWQVKRQAIFACKIGSCSRLYLTTRQDYLTLIFCASTAKASLTLLMGF